MKTALLALAWPNHQQVNDAWLVAAAIHNAGYLATFDTRLTIHAIEPARVFIIPG